ncbi:MAG TPA: SDR family oxidoreductase [Gemmatimonadaceae bacterium]
MKTPSIFLTGATGAVGTDLLCVLARRAGTMINVLVRRTSKSGAERIKQVLGDTEVSARVNVVEGDVGAGASLGLDDVILANLRRETTHIIHAAGSTSFTLPLADARTANVDGTRNVLEFTRRCSSLKCGAFLSTVYVSGKRCGEFAEWDFGDGGAGFVNSYEQSKAEMEELVRSAITDLPLMLIRLSTVVGDSRTGRVTRFNTIHHAIRLLYSGLAPMIPGDADTPVDIISSDFAAAAILDLIEHARPHQVYHLASGRSASNTLGEILVETMSALGHYRPQWRKRTVERPLIVDLDTYELFTRSVEETGNPVLRDATRAMRTFAYQLAHPKMFETRNATATLAPNGISPQPSLSFYPRVVKYCLESNWGRAVL